MPNPGRGVGNPAQGNSYPVKTEDVSAPLTISFLNGDRIAQMINHIDPTSAKQAGDAHMAISNALAQTAQNLVDHATVLSQNWSGQAAQNAISQFQQLHDTAASLSQASSQTGSVLQWLGYEVLPWYKAYRFSGSMVQNITNGEQVDILNRLNDRLVQANGNLPDNVNKTQLPGSVNNGTPGTTNGLPNPGVPGVGLPGGDVPGGGLPGTGQGGQLPGVPGTGTVPGGPGTGVPGTGPGMPGTGTQVPGTGTQLPGTTQTAGYTGPPPAAAGSGTVPGVGTGMPSIPGVGGGPGLGGLTPIPPLDGLGGPGAAALSDGAGKISPEGAAAGEAAALGAQDGAAAEDMAGLPMGGSGAGQGGEKERKREAWMNEDDEIWGLNEVSTVPPVIGAA